MGNVPLGEPNIQVREGSSFGRTYRLAMTQRVQVLVRLVNDGSSIHVPEDDVDTAKAFLLKQAESSGGRRVDNPEFEVDRGAGQLSMDVVYAEVRSGWPLRALIERSLGKGADAKLIGSDPPASLDALTSPGKLRSWGADYRTMPIFPIWSGLLVNTALYASLVWLATFGLGIARRAKRTRRGRCAECGYELAGLTKCPECGTEAVKPDFASPVSLSRCFAFSLGRDHAVSLRRDHAVSLVGPRSTP